MQTREPPAARAEMLVRRPPAAVFEAFVDPAQTTNFWFTHGSARLEAGATVRWTWAMYGFSIDVRVVELVPNERLRVEWPGPDGPNVVEWRLRGSADGPTYVSIANTGFGGDDDALVRQIVGATEGFAFVLAGLKAWLEHGVRLNLIADRFPDGMASP